MKPAWSFLFLIGSIAVLSAADLGGSGEKPYRSDAPDGRLSVQAHQEKGYCRFNVEIVDLETHAAVLVFDPKARYIEAAWSPGGRFVAIEQNRSTHDSAVSVFSIARKTAKGLGLPKECEDGGAAAFEASTRKHARKADALKFHFTSEGLQNVKWLSPDKLVLSASGMGWWGGLPAGEKDTRFLAEYEITLRFAEDGTSSLEGIVLKKYDEFPTAGRPERS